MLIGIDTSRAFGNDRTGTENYSYHLVSHLLRLPEAKQHTFVLFTRPNVQIPDELRKKNVIIHPISYRYLWTQVGLAVATWQTNLDVLWIPAHTLPVLRRPSLKTVVTIHGLEYRWLPEYRNPLQRWYLPLSTYYAARHASRLIAVSEATKRDLVAETSIDPLKISVIYEGVSADPVHQHVSESVAQSIFAKYGIQKGKYILFVGTVQPRKNVPALVEAYASVRKDHPEIKLVIVGSVGWMAEEALSAPSRHGIQEAVIFTGRVPDEVLAALYAHAALYVQPSYTEGFGLPILESMAAGVPVITSDGGALPEVVGDAGVVVPLSPPRGYSSRLATAITSLLDGTAKARQLVSRAHARATQFTWERAARETLTVLISS